MSNPLEVTRHFNLSFPDGIIIFLAHGSLVDVKSQIHVSIAGDVLRIQINNKEEKTKRKMKHTPQVFFAISRQTQSWVDAQSHLLINSPIEVSKHCT